MLKVMLVDDDVTMRMNLKTLIEWEKVGFIVAAEAANGSECLEKLSHNHYDLVVTDMSMPVMDGVELLENICSKYPEIYVIAISGYDDYHYVRDSLKQGAVDYILKHELNEKVLTNVLVTVKNKIEERDQNRHRTVIQSEQLSEGRTLVVHKLIKSILSGKIGYDEARSRMDLLEISCDFKNYVFAIAEVGNYPVMDSEREDHFRKSLIDFIEKIISERCSGVATYLEKPKFVFFIDLGNANSTLYIHQLLYEIFRRIHTVAQKYMDVQLTIATSDPCNDFLKIPDLFHKMKNTIENRFYEEEAIIWEHNEAIKPETQFSLSGKDIGRLKKILDEGDQEQGQNFLDTLFDKCDTENVSVNFVQMMCVELISAAIQFCMKHNMEELRKELNEIQLKKDYTNKKFMELKGIIKEIYDKLFTQYKTLSQESGGNAYVMKARQYINANYQKEISLADTADYVGISSQYMSKLIKEETQKNFVELLSEKRIAVACDMLDTHNYKIKSIAKEVGFQNYNYFFTVFKKIKGITPVEYEKNIRSRKSADMG